MRAFGVLMIAAGVMIIRWCGRGHGWWGPEAHGGQTPNQAPDLSGVGTLPPGTPPNLLPGMPGSPLPMPPTPTPGTGPWSQVYPGASL